MTGPECEVWLTVDSNGARWAWSWDVPYFEDGMWHGEGIGLEARAMIPDVPPRAWPRGRGAKAIRKYRAKLTLEEAKP